MLDWIKTNVIEIWDDNYVYSLKACQNFEVVPLIKDYSYLVLKWDSEKFNLDFAVMEFFMSDMSDTMLKCTFYGSGPTGNLRECRHTYWGENGYVFYPHGPTIIAAFKELSKYYDEMTV